MNRFRRRLSLRVSVRWGGFRQPRKDKVLIAGATSESQTILLGEVDGGPDLVGEIMP